MKAQQILSGAMPTVRILWGALTLSNVLLGVVTVMVPSPVAAVDSTLEVALGAVAVALAIVSFVLPARAYAGNVARSRSEVAEPEPMRGGVRGPARFAQPEKAARHALAVAQTAFILSMALSEAVSLLGLVLHMQGAPMAVSSAFIAAGTLLAALRFPTLERLVGPYERLHGATFAA